MATRPLAAEKIYFTYLAPCREAAPPSPRFTKIYKNITQNFSKKLKLFTGLKRIYNQRDR